MSCKGCRGELKSTHVNDIRKLYNPGFFSNTIGSSGSSRCLKNNFTASPSMGKCRVMNNFSGNNGVDQDKSYYSKDCNLGLRRYETQPWFQNLIVQAEWKNFVDQLVTPKNIGTRLCPGPDDWEFKCHKARALIGPTVPCTWELPEQDKCMANQYGINRDWRRYNTDQRMETSDINCGCNDEPVCRGKKVPEWVSFTGKKYGARYISWGNRGSGIMPYPHRPTYNYQSRPQCS